MKKAFYIGFKGRIEAYIYIWFSKKYRLVYVGETNNIHGVVGRANQHVSHSTGTLYSKVYASGYNMDEIDDFILLSFPLPREKRFISADTSYRISVEYMVQQNLIELRKDVDCPYKCISYVTTGPYNDQKKLQRIAKTIAEDFKEIYVEA